MGGDIALYMLGLLIVFILMGVHIGVALAICSALGVWLMVGFLDTALSILGNTAYEAVRKDVFAVIPLFVLMGDFIGRSGAAGDLYRICDRTLKRLPGRLAIATIAGNTVFAAVTGVSIASAAAFSRIAYPEMKKVGYKQTFALGAVAGSACLGMLIPPSILLIVWAVLTEMSIGALFIAGLLPGILLALLFAGYVIIAAARNPAIAPPFEEALVPLTKDEMRSELIGGLGILGLVLLVIGGIWTGAFTPTEAAGFGAIGALIIGVVKGMRWRDIVEAIFQGGPDHGTDHVPADHGADVLETARLRRSSELHPGTVFGPRRRSVGDHCDDDRSLDYSWDADRQRFDHSADGADILTYRNGIAASIHWPSRFSGFW